MLAAEVPGESTEEATETAVQDVPVTSLIPKFHVVLLDDDDHTYDYVLEMLADLFGHSLSTAYTMAVMVDTKGRIIVDTTHTKSGRN